MLGKIAVNAYITVKIYRIFIIFKNFMRIDLEVAVFKCRRKILYFIIIGNIYPLPCAVTRYLKIRYSVIIYIIRVNKRLPQTVIAACYTGIYGYAVIAEIICIASVVYRIGKIWIACCFVSFGTFCGHRAYTPYHPLQYHLRTPCAFLVPYPQRKPYGATGRRL